MPNGDSVRLQSGLERLDLNLASLTFHYSDERDDQNIDLLGPDWGEVQTLVEGLQQNEISKDQVQN